MEHRGLLLHHVKSFFALVYFFNASTTCTFSRRFDFYFLSFLRSFCTTCSIEGYFLFLLLGGEEEEKEEEGGPGIVSSLLVSTFNTEMDSWLVNWVRRCLFS